MSSVDESTGRVCDAFILAGGRSSRMKRDKAGLRIGGLTFINHIQNALAPLGLNGQVIRQDARPNAGPLTGLESALQGALRSRVLILSCDMPLISSMYLRSFLQANRHASAVFTSEDDRLGFSCLLSTELLPLISRLLDAGERAINALKHHTEVRLHRPAPDERRELLNVNTPADLRQARRLWQTNAARGKQKTAGNDEESMAAKRQPRPPILQLTNLQVRRGGAVILNGIDWQANQGEHWVILGANGSGKTSMLSAMTGYLTPSGGEIELLGESYGHTEVHELRKKIGMVSSSIRQMMAFDEPALQSVVSGRYAMIDYWGKVKKDDRERALKILRQIECLHLQDRPWGFLSQGEQQRILIGRALMADPRLLILDEPCAGLDPAAREHFLQFLDRFGRARKRQVTLVLVTHHVEEITPIFTHALLLRDGKALAAGPIATTLRSQNMSALFDCDCRLNRRNGRYSLSVARSSAIT